MIRRRPACGNHDPHPAHWHRPPADHVMPPGSGCAGWTVADAGAEVLAAALDRYLEACGDVAPPGVVVQCHPAAFDALAGLWEPAPPGTFEQTLTGWPAVGVPLLPAPLAPGQWQLTGPGGAIIDQGVIR